MEITIRIELPEGATVSVERSGSTEVAAPVDEDLIQQYWDFMTENSRRLFHAMAEAELDAGGPVKFDDIAERLGVSFEEVLTYNRNAARGQRKWRDENNGAEPPIRPIAAGIAPGGYRRKRVFRLPPGVAEVVAGIKEGR